MTGNLAERLSVDDVARVWRASPTPQKSEAERIAVIGLGYVGLPVAVALARNYARVTGYDTNAARIESLQNAHDWTNEVPHAALAETSLDVTTEPAALAAASAYIVAVPTPVTQDNSPDFGPLLDACRLLAPYLKFGDLVIFESTVYPGVTEDICGQELAQLSGLEPGHDFNLAYSPERISPGDPVNRLETITKIVSADTPLALARVATIYESIISAGVHRAPSIKVAEAAKVFENTQRDVNIGLMNEFAVLCDRLDIRTRDVIAATATKWNALPFTPGLVGGHCIGVDPHYLATCARANGLEPRIMDAARTCNEQMAALVVARTLDALRRQGKTAAAARIGIFGLTFKEDVPDLRNSKVFDIIEELEAAGAAPLIHDPVADENDAARHGIDLAPAASCQDLDAMILAVSHSAFLCRDGRDLIERLTPRGALIDVRSVFNPHSLPSGIDYWSL